MQPSSSPFDAFVERFGLRSYAYGLTYAERQLDASVRARLVAEKSTNWASSVALTFLLAAAKMIYVGPMPTRILGAAIVPFAVRSLLRQSRRTKQIEAAINELQQAEPQETSRTDKERQADKIVEPFVNEFHYAERQQIKAGRHAEAMENAYRRRRWYVPFAMMGAALCLPGLWAIGSPVGILVYWSSLRNAKATINDLQTE